jgi:hypothetical protein
MSSVNHGTGPCWRSGGGIVAPVEPALAPRFVLPDEAVLLSENASPSFHITLIGRKSLLSLAKELESHWDAMRPHCSQPPQPRLDPVLRLAMDAGRKTWFLHILNQAEFRHYVQDLSCILDEMLYSRSGCRFVNPEENRYFHLSIANNCGGNPLESIGSIQRPSDC